MHPSQIILLPVLDILVYPFFRRIGFRFTPLRRVFAGFIFGALAMTCAAVVQHKIYQMSVCGKYAATCEAQQFVDLNVWAQTPCKSRLPFRPRVPYAVGLTGYSAAYVLIALSEIFASVTTLEYAFTSALLPLSLPVEELSLIVHSGRAEAPKSMRSMIMSIQLFMTAISSA